MLNLLYSYKCLFSGNSGNPHCLWLLSVCFSRRGAVVVLSLVCVWERERACLFAVLRLSVWAVFLYQCTCCSEMSCFSYRICIYIITAPSCKVYTSVYPGPGQPWLHICLSSQRFRTNSVSKIWFQIFCHG